MTDIGFIGLGQMGGPIATHLVEAGHDLTVHDLRQSAVEALTDVGAERAATSIDVTDGTDVVFLSLPSPREVRAVTTDIKDGLEPGAVLIDLTTSTPGTTVDIAAQLADRDVEVLGAPVSGGASGAEAGTLSVMVGGSEQVYQECTPLFDAFTDDIFYLGENPGNGHGVKLLNNYLSFAGFLSACEAVILGQSFGLDFSAMVDVFNASTGRNVATEDKLPNYIATGDDLGFTFDLLEKDLRLLTEFADDNDMPLLMGSMVRQHIGYARSRSGGTGDVTELYDFLEDMMIRQPPQ